MLEKTIRTLGLTVLLTTIHGQVAFARSTNEVWDHHIQGWEARSVEAIVSDYSDESVLVLNNQIFKGRDQIAHVFIQLFKIFDKGFNRIDEPLVLDRFVYITWNYTPTGDREFFGADTFVIESGKIVLQTIASTLYGAYPVKPLEN